MVQPAIEYGTTGEVGVSGGKIRYRDAGSGPPILFVHGLLANSLHWRKVVAELAPNFRCLAPDLPLGAHALAMDRDADLSPPGIAALVADFAGALGLDSPTLVGNDSGGAISQMVAANHGDAIGRLVLTDCDAFENFLPPRFRYLQLVARVPGSLAILVQSMRLRPIQRLPIAFGSLTKRPIEQAVLDAYLAPARGDAAIRRDVAKFLRGISKRQTLAAAEGLRSFAKPALIVWSREDRFFPLAHAERLAEILPDARLEPIEDSGAFVPEDQPERLAGLIADFAA